MKQEISSLELYYVLKELQDLKDGRIDKIYQDDRSFLITMHVSRKGKKFLKILPNVIYTTDYKEEFPETPPGFCTFLRKRLANTSITSISQINFERIVEIVFENKDVKYFMIVELFGNGNVILCDENHKIVSALESHKWKDRTVRGGISYEFPPEQQNILSMTEKEFTKIIKTSSKDSIVKSLAIDLSLGGTYAEEACAISNIEKTKKKLTQAELSGLFDSNKKLLNKKIKAIVIENEILPFDLKSIEGEGKPFASFNEAIDSVFSERIKEKHESTQKKSKDKALEKVEVIIKQQEETIKGLQISSEENQKKGEFIYENYEQVKKILDDMKKARDKLSWSEIKEKLKGNKIVKKINEREGKITVEL